MRTIKLLNRDYGITIILITHEMDEAAQCDRVIVVDHGTVHMDAPPEKVFSHVAEMRALGLDVPQPTELCDILRQNGYDLSPEIMTVEDCVDAIAALLQGTADSGQK
jgi:energy-coupling factor transport system ATP-binding protein